jgi:hypothetical protein
LYKRIQTAQYNSKETSNNDDDDDDDNNNNKYLITETQRMWNVRTTVTPVIIGATGTISKSFRKYLSSVPGKHDIK